MKTKDVSVIGLGKLGLCLAAVLAHRGYRVYGVDVDKSRVESINSGISPTYEPKLEGLIKASNGQLTASLRYEDSIASSQATFVVVPTPSERTGEFSLKFVKQAIRKLGRELAKKNSYHLVVLTSTVMPRSMDVHVQPLLEKSSGKTSGKDFGLCYNPEFIALGDVIKGLLNPDFVLIGESDHRAGEILTEIYDRVCTNSPPIERMNFINAEIAKISLNSFVTMKMSFANTVAEICEKIPGANSDKITSAIGKDKRVGGSYLKGALGYGGPCFPRDNIAFSKFASRIGAQADLARTTHQVNSRQLDRVFNLIKKEAPNKKTRIGILGLSYKPNTNIIDESQSLMLASRLAGEGFETHVYDPASMSNARAVLGNLIKYENSIEDCVSKSELCVVATPWREIARINPTMFRGKTLIDCWRIFENRLTVNVRYVPLGQYACHVGRRRSRRSLSSRRARKPEMIS